MSSLIFAEAEASVSSLLQNANLIYRWDSYSADDLPWKNPEPGTATTPAFLINSSTNSTCKMDNIELIKGQKCPF